MILFHRQCMVYCFRKEEEKMKISTEKILKVWKGLKDVPQEKIRSLRPVGKKTMSNVLFALKEAESK